MRAETTRAVIYGRNSTAKQKSIDDQQSENRAAAQAHGWQVVANLSDPTSASRYATKIRANWARLLELLSTVDVVVMWEPSRGDRTLASWVAFLDSCREHGVRVHAVSHQRVYDPANARDYRSLAEDGVDSAYEADKISMRVRRGHASAAASGRPHASTTFGYTRRYDPATKAFVGQYEDPANAALVRGIIGAVAAGEPISAICKRLNRAGVATPRGAQWYAASVKFIATNPAYRPHPEDPARGCRAHNGQTYPAQWPPLVDEVTWRSAAAVLGTFDKEVRSHRRASAPGQIRHLLSGAARVMTTGCGGRLAAHPGRQGRGANYRCAADSCASCPMAELDEYVTALVVARLSRMDVRGLWLADDTATRAAAGELARLRAELDAARASFYAPGGISAAALAGKEAAMAPPIADAERRARPAGVPLAALELVDAASLGKERVRPTFDALPLPAQREIIAGLFASLVLGPNTTRITRWTSDEERAAIVGDRVAHEWRRT